MDSPTRSVLTTVAGVLTGVVIAFVFIILFPNTPEPVTCQEIPECREDFYKSNMDYCQGQLIETNKLGTQLWEDYYDCYWAYNCTDDKQWCLDNDWTPDQIDFTQKICEVAPNYEQYYNKYEK